MNDLVINTFRSFHKGPSPVWWWNPCQLSWRFVDPRGIWPSATFCSSVMKCNFESCWRGSSTTNCLAPVQFVAGFPMLRIQRVTVAAKVFRTCHILFWRLNCSVDRKVFARWGWKVKKNFLLQHFLPHESRCEMKNPDYENKALSCFVENFSKIKETGRAWKGRANRYIVDLCAWAWASNS